MASIKKLCSFKWLLFLLLAVFTLAAWKVFSIYNSKFPGPLSDEHHVFAEFGDFVGGVFNPILTFLTIVLLVVSLYIQMKELKATRKELNRSATAQEENIKAQERTALIPIASQMLDKHFKKLSHLMFSKLNLKEFKVLESNLGETTSSLANIEIFELGKIAVENDAKFSDISPREKNQSSIENTFEKLIDDIVFLSNEISSISEELQKLDCHHMVYFEYLRDTASYLIRVGYLKRILTSNCVSRVESAKKYNNRLFASVINEMTDMPPNT